MKTKEELKKELHRLIDSIEDELTLHVLNEDIVPYVIEKRTKKHDEPKDDLTVEQQKELEDSIAQADSGEIVSWDVFLNATSRWRKNNCFQTFS